jgi:pyruvate formate lyase activating enzyme
MKALYDLTPFTLLDFPDIPAAIFWFAGCNLRCVYCYNPDIVLGSAHIDEARALIFNEANRTTRRGRS